MKNIIKFAIFSFLFLCGTNVITASAKETTVQTKAYAERLRFKMISESTTNDRHSAYMKQIQEVREIQNIANSYGENFELGSDQTSYLLHNNTPTIIVPADQNSFAQEYEEQMINDSPKIVRSRRSAITSKSTLQQVEQEKISTPKISPVHKIVADEAGSPQKYIHTKKVNHNKKNQISQRHLELRAKDYHREKFYNDLDTQLSQTILDFQTRNVTRTKGLSELQIKEVAGSKEETNRTQDLIATWKATQREFCAQQYRQQKTDSMPEITSPIIRTTSLNFCILPDSQK